MADTIEEVRDQARALRAEFDAAAVAAQDEAALQALRDRSSAGSRVRCPPS